MLTSTNPPSSLGIECEERATGNQLLFNPSPSIPTTPSTLLTSTSISSTPTSTQGNTNTSSNSAHRSILPGVASKRLPTTKETQLAAAKGALLAFLSKEKARIATAAEEAKNG
jgi:hypothetical protein